MIAPTAWRGGLGPGEHKQEPTKQPEQRVIREDRMKTSKEGDFRQKGKSCWAQGCRYASWKGWVCGFLSMIWALPGWCGSERKCKESQTQMGETTSIRFKGEQKMG